MTVTNTIAWPQKTRELETRMMDSRRWNGFPFRDGDIIVDTWAKSGTTWTQQILAQLIFGAPEEPWASLAASPWFDMVGAPLEEVMAQVEAQTHRRFLKSHLPLDALVFSPKAKYLFVGRDVRDVVWSLYNHEASYTDGFLEFFNGRPGDLGPKMARPTRDVRRYYLHILETGGDPDRETGAAIDGNTGLSSFWSHVQGFWDYRHLPNLLLVHFNNLKADLPAEIRRIARFLDIPLDEALVPKMVEHCGIDYMRKTAASNAQADAQLKKAFNDGANSFFNKGTNGRWRDVLSAAEIARADEVAAANLTPDCAHWLKTGELPD